MRLLGHFMTVFAGLVLEIAMWLVTGRTGNLAVWLTAIVVTFVVIMVSLILRKVRRPRAIPASVAYLPRPGEHGTVYGGRRAA